MFRSKAVIFSSIPTQCGEPNDTTGSTFQFPILLPYSDELTSIPCTSTFLMDTVLATHQLAMAQNHIPMVAPQPHERLDVVMTPSTSRSSPPVTMKGERCVGCGSESSIRVHYGASSCHGCKAFFRRSVFEGRVYHCGAENNCDITNESRNRCRACRLRNCLVGGMNPKHVREERSKIEKLPISEVPSSEQEGLDKRKIPEEHQLTLFMCALEKQTELLTDEDVRGNDVICEWSRGISLTFGLQNPQLVIKRSQMIWSCSRIMKATDIYSSWYRAFVLHADWAMSIPDFRVLPLSDQTLLFKQNFMAFGWITYAFKCYQQNQQNIGIPLGNGAYIPYTDEEQKLMAPRWSASYGVVCKKLMDLIVKPMIELKMTEEEYCLLKTIALFQQDCLLSENGSMICNRVRDRLLEALATHIERRFPNMSSSQRTMRALKSTLMLPSFTHIGQVESSLIQHLSAADLYQLSGVPMELVGGNLPQHGT